MQTLSHRLGSTLLISYGIGAVIAWMIDGSLAGAIAGGLIAAIFGGVPICVIQAVWHFIRGKSPAAAKGGALLAVPGAAVGGMVGLSIGLAGLAFLWMLLIFSDQRTAAHGWVADPWSIGGWFLGLSTIGAILGGVLAGTAGSIAGALTAAFRRS
jgi:hypothetical protein